MTYVKGGIILLMTQMNGRAWFFKGGIILIMTQMNGVLDFLNKMTRSIFVLEPKHI